MIGRLLQKLLASVVFVVASIVECAWCGTKDVLLFGWEAIVLGLIAAGYDEDQIRNPPLSAVITIAYTVFGIVVAVAIYFQKS